MKKLLLCGTLIMMCLFDINSQTLSYPFTNASLAGLTQFGSSLTPTTDRINAATNSVDLNGDYLRTTSTFQDYSFTTSFWVNTSTVDGTKRTIIDHSNKNSNFDNNSDAGWYTYLKNGKIGLAANYWHTHDVSGSPVVAYTGYVYTEATTNIADGYWHNIIVTAQRSIIYSGSSEKKYVYAIYVDGVLENTQTVSRFTSSLSNVNCGLVITNKAMTIANNGSSNLTDRYLDKIDDIKYYTSVVSSTVISTLANENRCNTPTNIIFSAITANSVNIDWNQNTDALSWDMIYAVSGQPMNTGTLVSSIAVSDYSLTSLTQSTTYDIYIKSNCTGFSGWWTLPNAFTTLCPSTFANAVAQNYTVQLNSFGTASITTSNINNGSSVDCGVLNVSLSKNTFNCSDVGVNTVTLTVTDNQAHTSTASANVTVLGIIDNETLTYNQSSICSGATATVNTTGSVNGIKYSLRDDATNTIVGNPVIGNGSSLTFTTGVLNSTKTFNVLAELQNGGNYGLDFDGTNDVVNTSISTPSTNSLTLEAWIFPRATTVKRIITKFKNVATESGEFILDTYNPTNNGKGLRFYVEGAGAVTHTISVANVLTLNAWNHVATTFNNGIVKLYVNGLAVATNTAPFTSIPSNTATVCFGEDATIGALEYFNGKMDDIRIWNTVRTQIEIAGNMNNCLAGNEIGLINYFKISENTGSTITDLVTNSIGSMSGMTPTTAWTAGNVDCGSNLCEFEMTQLITITVNPTPVIAVNSGSICSGSSFTIVPSGADTYTIQGGNAIITPTSNSTYTVSGTSTLGCISSTIATSSITVNPIPTIAVNSGSICTGNSFTITPSGATTYTIQDGSAIITPTSNSTYTVSGTSALGCISSGFATSNVTVNALPVINASSNSTLICTGETASLTVNGTSTSYTWNTSATGSSISVSPTVTTTYSVTGTDVNGCSNNAVVTQSVSLCTGINQLINNNKTMTVFPNPGSGDITVQTDEAIQTVYIFNILGDLAQTENSKTFSVAELSSGIYIIHVKTDKGINTLRFVKE
ncbi:MAG: LamG-like jellyroll fold domain-containing protein [Bacteroidota bacterium]